MSSRRTLKEHILNELGRATLGSYIKKANFDVGTNLYTAGSRDPHEDPRRQDPAHSKRWAKIRRRSRGVGKAIDRLTREEQRVDELSRGALTRYAQRASGDYVENDRAIKAGSAHSYPEELERHGRQRQKRLHGMSRAISRLAKGQQ